MNIILRELKYNLKSLLIWCASMMFLIYAGMIKYSAFAETGDTVNAYIKNLPVQLRTVLGLTEDSDLTSVAVFYSIFFIYFLLLAAVHSGMLGASIISKEERDKTADFLFVKPITRRYVISCKIFVAFLNLLLFNLVTFLTSIISVKKYQGDNSLTHPIFLIMVALFFVQIIYFGAGLLFGAVAKSSKKAASLATFVILGSFIIKVLIDLKDDFEFLKILTPFRYFDANEIMSDHIISLSFSILALGLTLIFVFLTYQFFQKRDLSV